MPIKSDIEENTPRYLEELFDLLRIPSISTDKSYAPNAHPQISRAATWVADQFSSMNGDVNIHKPATHPVVTAQFGNDPLKPTVLVYGHYDVQPPMDENKWESPPFEPEIRDGNIYARGATDDKGQLFTHIKAVELMQQYGELPCNIHFLIEGAEEISSAGLSDFLAAHPEVVKCDAAVISDTAIIAEDTPSITVGLRGHTRLRLTVTGPQKDLHSGLFGGAVPNPIEAIAKMVASVTDENGKIAIPGFYDGIREYDTQERATINQRDIDQDLKDETGVTKLTGEKGYTSVERIGIRPAFTTISIHGGPSDPENKIGVISSSAFAMLAMRTVPGQDPVKVGEMLSDHLKNNAPEGVTVKTEILGASSSWALKSFDDMAYQAANEAMETSWGKKPIPELCGASIPVVEMLQNFGITPTLMGFGLESDNLHSPNEHISVNRFQKGIETSIYFFNNFARKFQESKKAGLIPRK